MISGLRWYRTSPSQLTQLLVVDNAQLWVGGDPNSTYPYAALPSKTTFNAQFPNTPVSFAPTHDPALSNGSGGDIVVMTGVEGLYSFASISLTLYGNVVPGQAVVCTLVNGGTTVTVPTYTTVAGDNTASVAKALVKLINASAAVIPGSPFITATYFVASYPGSTNTNIFFGALNSGSAGNSLTVNITITPTAVDGSKLAVTPLGTNNLTGGGLLTAAPVKWDGTAVTGLSSQITQTFTGCVSWHDHVWYWGDPNNPDTLYASDIDSPETWSFMAQNGGYDIGAGDGDPVIRAVVPAGNILYVFKSNSIYAITGYDFQTGEYEFQVSLAIKGHGSPNSSSVAILKNNLVFWDGHGFYRLQPGSFEVEHIGRPIPLTEGLVAKGNQALVRAVAGSFLATSFENESFSIAGNPTTQVYSSVAMFAVDIGTGIADTVMVFDDDASTYLQNYAWSRWTGWKVGCWIPFGGGPSVSGIPEETPLLCWGQDQQGTPLISAYGTNPTGDNGNSIPWVAQTGWATLGTGAREKQLHRVFVEMESSPGMVLSATITPSVTVEQSGNPNVYEPYMMAFASTGGQANSQVHQTLIGTVKPFLRADAWVFAFGVNDATSSFEIVEVTLDYIEEPFLS